MAEKPILFSAPMVKAILDGRKTMTRRVVKMGGVESVDGVPHAEDQYGDWHKLAKFSPYHADDALWVREAFWLGRSPGDDEGQGVARYADHSFKSHPDLDPKRVSWCRRWEKKPSIFMPRWASRITLRITDVRVERLQEITAADMRAEGIDCLYENDGSISEHFTKQSWVSLWDSINAKRGYGWDVNPYVWVVSFEKA